MNLANRPPLGLKQGKQGKDRWYLAEVHRLPCCICMAFGEPQASPTQAHHPICERYSREKTPDREAIPICEGHHLGMFDTSKVAIHRERKRWVERYGSDRQYIAQTQDAILGANDA